MTDAQIGEVYAIAREALNYGQPAFQVQAFPFRMTAENMARRRNDKNLAFWENLKEGADHFEETKLEPKVNVCGHKYVFNAEPKDGGTFDPNAACPNYEVNPLIAMAVDGKKRRDKTKFDELVTGGLQTAEAYTPQNGRERRALSDPIHKPAPVVMVAEAQKPQSGFALAMVSADAGNAGASVPMPVPSPYRTTTVQKPGKPGGMFAWMREDNAADANTGSTPAATTPSSARSAATTVAMANRAPQPARPIAASLAPVQKDKPFYKKLWGFGAKEEDAPAAQPVHKASAIPAPAPRPAASAPAQASAPAKPASVPVPAPAPAKTAESAAPPAPTRTDAAFGAFGVPIVPTGGFKQ
jgi:hypothetical protein